MNCRPRSVMCTTTSSANANNTEVLLVISVHNLTKLVDKDLSLIIGLKTVQPSDVVCNLDVRLSSSYLWSNMLPKFPPAVSTSFSDCVRYADVPDVKSLLSWYLCLSSPNWIIVTQSADLNIECSPESTEYSSATYLSVKTLRSRRCIVLCNMYTGCWCGHGYSANSAYWCTKSTVVKLQNASATLSTLWLQWQHDVVCDLETIRVAVYLGSGLILDNEPFCLLNQQHGTDFNNTIFVHQPF